MNEPVLPPNPATLSECPICKEAMTPGMDAIIHIMTAHPASPHADGDMDNPRQSNGE